MPCKNTSRAYLTWVNGSISSMGVVLLALGVYAYITYKTELSAVSSFAPFAGITLGGVVFLVGLLGCYGAQKQNKFVLVFYWFVMTVVTVLVLALGVLVLLSMGYLDKVDVGDSASLVTGAHERLNDFSLSVYESCCEALNFVPNGVPNVTACSASPVGVPCIRDPAFAASVSVSQSFCVALAQTKINGVPVGGLSSTGTPTGCASPEAFQGQFSNFVRSNILPVGIVLVILSLLLIIADIMSCVLICSNREEYDAEYRRKVQQQQQGGALATSQQPGVQYA
jgi:hypothetical protein